MQQAALQTVLLSTARQRPRVTPAHPLRTQLLGALLFWLILCLLAAAAGYNDVSLDEKKGTSFLEQFQLFTLLLLPLGMLSLCLTVAFERSPTTLLRTKNICWLYLVLLVTFLPSFIYFEILVQHLFYDQEIPHLAKFLRLPSGPNCWIDGMVFTSIFAVQVFYALWFQAQRRMDALQAVQHDNLALRLSLLQGQLEPQFLLSSLDGIGGMVRDAERQQAIRALARLSDLLRYALRSGQQNWLSVADEIGFMRDYLDLQVLRFGARLEVQWQLEERNWAMFACPALLLHQLIEQTISAGMQCATDQQTLKLAFSLQNGSICIVLTSTQRVANAGDTVGPPPCLAVLGERLQMLYGSTAYVESKVVDAEMCTTLCFSAQGRGDD